MREEEEEEVVVGGRESRGGHSRRQFSVRAITPTLRNIASELEPTQFYGCIIQNRTR